MVDHKKSAPLHLDVLIPGLFEGLSHWPENHEIAVSILALPALLSRANFNRQSITGFEPALFHCFDPELTLGEELPVAALRPGMTDKPVMCADPVHMEIGTTGINLIAGNDLKLTQAELAEMAELLNNFLQAENCRISFDQDGGGILQLPEWADVHTTALSAVGGQLLTEKLPLGPDQAWWHKLGNEIQMLLHNTAFNQEREAAGKLPVNTLWFWGGGELTRPLKPRYQLICSDHPFAKSLARQSDTEIISILESKPRLLQTTSKLKVLLVLDELLAYSQADDYLGWTEQMTLYDQQWFRPLKKALENAAIKSLSIKSTTGECFDLYPYHRWRFWRGQRALKSWIKQ